MTTTTTTKQYMLINRLAIIAYDGLSQANKWIPFWRKSEAMRAINGARVLIRARNLGGENGFMAQMDTWLKWLVIQNGFMAHMADRPLCTHGSNGICPHFPPIPVSPNTITSYYQPITISPHIRARSNTIS
jgi:hypothetical protein